MMKGVGACVICSRYCAAMLITVWCLGGGAGCAPFACAVFEFQEDLLIILCSIRCMRTKELAEIKKIAVPVLRRNSVVRAGIFGSFARGEAKKGSDIDILIEIKAKKFSLLDLVGLELELKEKLKRKVDLVEYSTIHPLLKDRILREEVPIV